MKKLFTLILTLLLFFKPTPAFAACVSYTGSCSAPYTSSCEYGGDLYCCEAASECQPGPIPPPFENRGITNPALPALLGGTNAPYAVGRYLSTVVSGLIAIGGLLTFFYILYGAFGWLSSGGDQEKIKENQRKITQAFAGFFILVAIFAIANLLESFLGISLLNIDLSSLAPAN